jgi:tryptophanase
MAFPRRLHTQSHVDYLAELLLHVNEMRDRISGMRLVESPLVLRHFTRRLEPVDGQLIRE